MRIPLAGLHASPGVLGPVIRVRGDAAHGVVPQTGAQAFDEVRPVLGFGGCVAEHPGREFAEGYEIRGFQTRRFAGESALYGNFDLRLRLFRATILLPSHVGVFGLADAGRVWLDGEDSQRWHADGGGGVWLSALNYRGTVSAYIAHGNEGNIFRIGTGFTF